MPFKFSDYLEASLLEHLFSNGGSSYTPASNIYAGLFTALTEATDGETRTEISTSGTAYVRQPVTFDAFAGAASANDNLIEFPVATLNWGTPTYMGLFDQMVGGNMLYWGPVSNPVAINIGEQFQIAQGGIQIAISGLITTFLGNLIGEHTLRGNNVLSQYGSSSWAAILTSFTNDATYTECADVNYARKQAFFTTPGDIVTSISNTGSVDFPPAAGAFTASYLSVFSAASGGDMLLRGPLSPTRVMTIGKVLKLPIGQLMITAD